MDKVYTNFLSRKGKENILSCNISTLKKLLPFDEIDIDLNINITEIDSKRFFISNTESKGFLVEKPSECPKYEFCSLYKKIITSLGCIKELYNFKNEYFENIAVCAESVRVLTSERRMGSARRGCGAYPLHRQRLQGLRADGKDVEKEANVKS